LTANKTELHNAKIHTVVLGIIQSLPSSQPTENFSPSLCNILVIDFFNDS